MSSCPFRYGYNQGYYDYDQYSGYYGGYPNYGKYQNKVARKPRK